VKNFKNIYNENNSLDFYILDYISTLRETDLQIGIINHYIRGLDRGPLLDDGLPKLKESLIPELTENELTEDEVLAIKQANKKGEILFSQLEIKFEKLQSEIKDRRDKKIPINWLNEINKEKTINLLSKTEDFLNEVKKTQILAKKIKLKKESFMILLKSWNLI
jgi:hypothetical protein